MTFELGRSLPGRDACFVRRVGEPRVWLLESDPRLRLDAPSAAGLPPLLDPHVVPAAWPGWQAGLARVDVRVDGEPRFVLEKRVPPPDATADPRQRPSFLWVLDPGLSERVAASLQSTAYTLFLSRIPYTDVLGPRDREALGLANPVATLELTAADGAVLALAVGRALPDGRLPVWNGFTNRPYLLANDVAGLLVPPREAFTTTGEENPWDPYLRR